MNKLEKVNRLSPSGLYADCAMFTIDDIEESFVLHGVTEAGKEYAFSAWFIGYGLVINGKAMPETEDWTQCKFTFIASGNDVPINFLSPGVYYLFNSKIERGNKFTDWMPAPEDTEAEISGITEITTTHTTQISTMQGQITALIAEDTIIKGEHDALVSRYNATVVEVDSIKTTIGEHTTLIDANTQDILAVSTKATTIEADLNGIKTRVSTNETEISKKADGTEVESLAKRVTTSETAIEQNAAEIELRATKEEVQTAQTDANEAKSDVEALGTRVEAAEASIIVHTKEIALTVKETDVTGDYLVSKINLSSTSATIEAKHINLIGAVTAECIATGAVTTDKLASKAVKAQNIDAEDLFAQKITATNMTIKGTSTFEGDVYAKYLEAQAINVSGDFKIRWDYFDATAFGVGMSGNADGTALGHIELYSDAVNEYGCILNFGLQLNEKVYAAKEIECANNIKATDFKTSEGISLTDVYEKTKVDYIVEQGTSGIWTYRKWNSGIAECWGSSSGTFNCTTTWGNTYISSGQYLSATYPFTFKNVPHVQFTCDADGYSVWAMCTGTDGTTTSPPQYQFCRGTSISGITVIGYWYAVGRWK